MSKRKEVEQLLSEIKQRLADSEQPRPVKENVPRKLQERVGTFLNGPENRDGRGVRTKAYKDLLKTLRKFSRAITHAHSHHAHSHPDGSVRRAASRLVRLPQWKPIEEIEVEATRFTGVLNKAGARRKEKEKCQEAEARRIEIDRRWTLVPILSTRQLEAVGKKLALCVGNKRSDWGRGYHDRLRSGSSEFWLLEDEAQPYSLIEVDVEDARVVAEAKAAENEDPKLTHELALKILKALDATADDVDGFANVGAYSLFIPARPLPHGRLSHASDRYDLWWSPRRKLVAVRRKKKGDEAWSLFRRERTGDALPTWEPVDYGEAVSESRFPSLLVLITRRYPILGRLLCPTGTTGTVRQHTTRRVPD